MSDTDRGEALLARLEDLCGYAEQGMLGESCFLSPAELHLAKGHLARCVLSGGFLEWGGFEAADRKKIFVLPEYARNVKSYSELADYGFENCICAVSVVGSGYRRLTHRDFLGAVLGLGIDRRVLGDICFFDEEKPRVMIVCEEAIADFIASELKKVGSDTVVSERMDIPDGFEPQRQFKHISDTVASARADCVVASLCSLSREKAKQTIERGDLEIEYESEERVDRTVTAPCIITVRGYGKFKINSLSDKTKKGRYRLDADKYM